LRLIRFPDTGKPKSCFVEMYTAEALEEAVALDGQDLRDRAVRVDVAEQKQDRGGSKGGYGDRGGGKGYYRGGYGDRNDRYGSRDPGPAFDRSMFGSAQPEGRPERDRGGDRDGGDDDRGERRKGGGRGWGKGKKGSDLPPEDEDRFFGSKSQPPRADTGADGAIADKPKKANPFGDAKAVNTAEADKRAEERLAREERSGGRGGGKGKGEKGDRPPREDRPPRGGDKPAKAEAPKEATSPKPVKPAAQPAAPKPAVKAPANAFAALGMGGDDSDDEDES